MNEAGNFYYYNEAGEYDSSDSDKTGSTGESGKRSGSSEEKPRIRVRHTQARSGSVINIILISAIAALLLGSVIYTLDRRNTMYNRVSAKNQELNLAEAENVRLQSMLESEMSAKNVEDYAENVLGMQKIDSSQIQYIKIQTGDVVSIPEKEDGPGAKIKEFFDRCVEYFRG